MGITAEVADVVWGNWRYLTDLKMKLADAYSSDTVIASSPGKEVHDSWAFYLHAALLRQAFAHCGKFPTTASLGVWAVSQSQCG
nr:putative cytochrome C biosynthesis protein [Ipomoea batatas]